MIARSTLTVLITHFAIGGLAFAADDFIWVEGESAISNSMTGHGWYDSVKKTELSAGNWLSNFRGGEQPVASYEIDAVEAGAHELWVRANPIQAAMSIRVNGGVWEPISFDKREQNLNIASDGKPDVRFVAWMKSGSVSLREGINAVEIRFESKNNNHGGLDCFVLSKSPFFPQGARKPGEKTGLADPGKWAFEPDRDQFSADALLDLISLNDRPAGRTGWVARSADGADFVDGAGEPIRFWAVNTTVQYRGDLEPVQEHARWLAKRGVNMVRHHGHLAPGKGSQLTDVNRKDMEAAWRLVAAMKEQGIYTTLSPYWAVSVSPQREWGLADAGGQNLTGLLFFDEKLQAAYKQWVRQLMTTPNPHTGVPLSEDSSVAIFQIQNEDSLLFWTESSIQSKQREALAQLFGQWLAEKYGSVDKAVNAWGGPTAVQGDDFGRGVVMPETIWHLTQSQRGPKANRLNDQLAFYTEKMRSFNTEIARFLKEDLGYRGLVNAGNWKTADQAKLLDAERYAYAANDVIGVNRYFNGGKHENPSDKRKAGYLVSQGDLFDGKSVLAQPAAFPLALRQVTGHPMIISESAWVPPLAYQTEGPFLVSAYSGLTGFDIFYWFSTGDIGFSPPIDKWQLSTPAQIGMFPAAALIHRMGYVEKADPVLLERRSPEDLWSRTEPLLPEEAGFDPNRDTGSDTSNRGTGRGSRVSPLAYLEGPVEVEFSAGESEVGQIDSLIDQKAKRVRSATGQHVWNYGDGVATLNTPKAQGATGSLKSASPITLSDLTLQSKDAYASISVVALDDVPIAQSNRILIQVGTIARPYGWRTRTASDGSESITSLGSSPWNFDDVQATIEIGNSGLSKVVQLDANGVSIGEVKVNRVNGRLQFALPRDAMYLIAE